MAPQSSGQKLGTPQESSRKQRRAASDSFAPGSTLSATLHAFTYALHVRRRAVPVIASTRRERSEDAALFHVARWPSARARGDMGPMERARRQRRPSERDDHRRRGEQFDAAFSRPNANHPRLARRRRVDDGREPRRVAALTAGRRLAGMDRLDARVQGERRRSGAYRADRTCLSRVPAFPPSNGDARRLRGSTARLTSPRMIGRSRSTACQRRASIAFAAARTTGDGSGLSRSALVASHSTAGRGTRGRRPGSARGLRGDLAEDRRKISAEAAERAKRSAMTSATSRAHRSTKAWSWARSRRRPRTSFRTDRRNRKLSIVSKGS